MMTSKEFIEHLHNAGYETTPYSGRGMDGRYCVSVNVDYASEAFDIGHALGLDHADNPGAPDSDALGKGAVLYWRNMPWPKG